MTFEDMMQMKRLGDTAVSPDGKWLAYSVTTVDLDQNKKKTELWLQAIGGGEPMKLAVALAGDAGLQFSSDGKRILFLSGRDGGQQVWVADFDPATGAASNAKKLTAIATEADNAKWSPDGKSIVFTSTVYPDCQAITTADFDTGNKCNAGRDAVQAASKVKAQIWTHLLYRHWDHYTGEKREHLFLVSVDGSGMRDLNPGDTHDVPPFSLEGSSCGCDFSPDSKELAFTENPDPVPAVSTSAQIYTLDLTNPAARPVKVSISAGGNFNPAYSPDGKWLAWRSQARNGYESDRFRLWLYDRATKTGKDLLPLFDLWVDEFTWSRSSLEVFFTAGKFGEENIFEAFIPDKKSNFINPWGAELSLAASGAEFSNLAITSPQSQLGTFNVDTESVIATRMTVRQPSEVVVIPLSDERLHQNRDALGVTSINNSGTSIQQITHLNDALLAQLDLPAMESFWFEVDRNDKPPGNKLPLPCFITSPRVGLGSCPTMLEGFLIRPPGFDAAKKYPVKFLIHGGPQDAWGDDWSYRWNAELFAANGYVVVMINPRGSTGYGQAIVEGVSGDWGGKPFTDLMTGLDYAEQHYSFIDKDRECALGASYGGYMANWILGHTDRFKCIVTHDGMFNAESAFGTTEEDWFNIWEFKGHPWDYYGKPDDENPFRKWSPSLYAKNFKTPTLVVHGQLDYRLDVSEGLQLFDTLQLLGVPSKMLYFPDEGHWVLKPQNSQLWWKTVNDWVDEWTKNSR
jgi:dipeptidyl aminopeptidase/acylaminoacyl peptidase